MKYITPTICLSNPVSLGSIYKRLFYSNIFVYELSQLEENPISFSHRETSTKCKTYEKYCHCVKLVADWKETDDESYHHVAGEVP